MSLFITFEGVEGSGKSTQIRYLKRYLEGKGFEVVKTREPGGTKLGEKIRKILLNRSLPISVLSELFLILAQRAEHVERVIKPSIENGKIVICDRFSDATLAYQGYGRGVDLGLVEYLNKIILGDLLPHLTILIDCDVDVSLRRKSQKSDRFEILEKEFHKRVREGYLRIAKSHPERVKVLDGRKEKEELKREIRRLIDELLEAHGL